MAYTVFIFFLRLAMRIAFSLKVEGKENIPKDGGYIFVSNHRSYTDPVTVSVFVPKPFAYMAKEELFKIPFFGKIISFFGAFPVIRGSGDKHVLEKAINDVKCGRNLLIFPEGTRSKDGKIGRGKTGAALIAYQADVDVYPVGIKFSRVKLRFRSSITVCYGKPIKAEEFRKNGEVTHDDLKNLKHRIMSDITTLVEGEISK